MPAISDELATAFASGKPRTAADLREALAPFGDDAIAAALATLVAAGVLEERTDAQGNAVYAYVHPERYAWAQHDVVVNPGGEVRRGAGG